jgi:hypothetical protein
VLFSSLAVDRIRLHEEKTTFIGVIYFNYKFRSHQSQLAILGSLARQVYEASHGTAVTKTMEDMYGPRQAHKSEPAERELQQALQAGFRHFTICYIVLDALDEYVEQYSPAKITDLLNVILSLGGNVKVLATSRILEGMVGLFRAINASTEEVVIDEIDMTVYVEKRLAEIRFPFEVSEEFYNEIVKEVVKGAKGRYVHSVTYPTGSNYCRLDF